MAIERIDCAGDEHPGIQFRISEAQCELLAAGIVPKEVKANCLGCLYLDDEDRRKAERPYHEPKKRKSA